MEYIPLTTRQAAGYLILALWVGLAAFLGAIVLLSPVAHAATASTLPAGPSWQMLRPALPLVAAAVVALVSQACASLARDPATGELPPSALAMVELVRALLVLVAAAVPELAGLGQGDTASVIAQGVVIWLVSHGYVSGGRAAAGVARMARRG